MVATLFSYKHFNNKMLLRKTQQHNASI